MSETRDYNEKHIKDYSTLALPRYTIPIAAFILTFNAITSDITLVHTQSPTTKTIKNKNK